ncbi:DinB family protein [Psychrobacillus sp. NPDC058041]|uniref:DinB family protein n=1 Tax=Psychrobacillus sp. NPDC058041 TaxID=3346310 RepID=UPI0036DD4D7A
MEQTIFQHMETVRGITKEFIQQIPEEIADIVPEGFNNSIRWNFGHIAFIQERLVFAVLGEELGVPSNYEELFSAGTKPADWKVTPPSLADILFVLTEQTTRIREAIQGNINKTLPAPFTNRLGITFHTRGETFLFSFYHEAMHMEVIKRIYRAITVE